MTRAPTPPLGVTTRSQGLVANPMATSPGAAQTATSMAYTAATVASATTTTTQPTEATPRTPAADDVGPNSNWHASGDEFPARRWCSSRDDEPGDDHAGQRDPPDDGDDGAPGSTCGHYGARETTAMAPPAATAVAQPGATAATQAATMETTSTARAAMTAPETATVNETVQMEATTDRTGPAVTGAAPMVTGNATMVPPQITTHEQPLPTTEPAEALTARRAVATATRVPRRSAHHGDSDDSGGSNDPIDNVAQGMMNIGQAWATVPNAFAMPMSGTTGSVAIVPGVGVGAGPTSETLAAQMGHEVPGGGVLHPPAGRLEQVHGHVGRT
ncbi:unnamed protein product [Phytophthora fragariaefolia]|uniref:Unnamed protein product n=1 Tax=Phytophthora fragariaefolia TaxID=1490495 RepID=A0A9W7CQJ0_9STRA|nr:unnamed protein product [Phytophthora fragariaefolia]